MLSAELLRKAIEAVKGGRLDEARRAIGEVSAMLDTSAGDDESWEALRIYLFCNRVIVDAMNGTPSYPEELARALELLERQLRIVTEPLRLVMDPESTSSNGGRRKEER